MDLQTTWSCPAKSFVRQWLISFSLPKELKHLLFTLSAVQSLIPKIYTKKDCIFVQVFLIQSPLSPCLALSSLGIMAIVLNKNLSSHHGEMKEFTVRVVIS
jgi:hypothetical protein